jgi:PleD family two-component response regulator
MDPELRVTLRIGVADDMCVSDHERLLTLAGRRMYHAKHAGRNRVCVTPPASSSECA